MSYIVDSFLIMSKQNLNFYMADPPKIFDLSLLTYKIGAIVVFVKRVCWCYIIKATIII